MRLVRLESHVRVHPPTDNEPRNEDDWLAAFEEFGREGYFMAEPDLQVALAFYRDALTRAHASTDPPYDPPPAFRPGEPTHQREDVWRSRERFPDLDAGFAWLAEILHRVCDGVPPVTEDEFRELAAWFAVNDDRLCQIAMPSHLLNLGDGRLTSCASLRYNLARGPRVDGAGRLAQDIRQLRQRYSVPSTS
jgi:hypothetical protein